jgi:hypothetical protein
MPKRPKEVANQGVYQQATWTNFANLQTCNCIRVPCAYFTQILLRYCQFGKRLSGPLSRQLHIKAETGRRAHNRPDLIDQGLWNITKVCSTPNVYLS